MRSLFLVALAVASCGGTRSEAVTTPSGRTGYTLTCEDPTDCYAEAGRLCPSGYDVLDSGQRTEDQRVANAFSSAGASVSGSTPQRHTKTMTQALIECRGASTAAPAPGATSACSRAARTGLYAMRFVEREGTCGPLPPELGRLRNADPEPANPHCVVEREAWSSDGCALERAIRCQTARGTVLTAGTTRQNADGSILSGVMGMRVISAAGRVECEGAYAVHAERQP